MSLTTGTHLGPFEVLGYIGAGGMGEVYRARDTRLNRLVAVKVLSAGVAGRPDFRERFSREAQAISALNHPHICALYDVGRQDGIDFLVMEYLEGETLAERLQRGRLPPDLVFRYATDIADALHAAHRNGVTHRDVKPANIILSRTGVKLLDFGLARLRAAELAPGGASVVTKTQPLTSEGQIAGTLQYMAPEQLEGAEADARTDIFAFGAVLYEMATGRKAFEGKTSASLIAAIMQNEPVPVAQLQPTAPAGLDHIIRRCLAKDPDLRWQSASDVKLELEWIAKEKPYTGVPVVSRGVPRLAWAALAVLASVLAVGLGFWAGHTKAPAPLELRQLTYSGHDFNPAASPDGRTVAFVSDRDGRQRIWLKELARGGEVAISEGPNDGHPRFSPDGSMVLFSRNDGRRTALYRLALVGGEPRKLVDDAQFGDWSPDGRRIVYLRAKSEAGRIVRTVEVAGADGSDNRQIATLGNKPLECLRWSPDGHTIAGSYQSGVAGLPASIFLVEADGANPRSISAPRGGAYISSIAWSGTANELIYLQSLAVQHGVVARARLIRQNVRTGGTEQVLLLPYDSSSLDLLGPGRLVIHNGSTRKSLREVHLTFDGRAIQDRWLTRGDGNDGQPAYSPDGQWVIFTSNRSGDLDLWEVSPKTGVIRRITEDPADDWDPGFTPDGKIIWSSNRTGNLEIWISDGDGSNSRQVTHDGGDAENPTATRDGWIIYASGNPAKQGIWKIRQDGTQPARLFAGQVSATEVSPDGQYVGYRDRLNQDAVAFVRVADGAAVPFQTGDAAFRCRWMPGGRAVAFLRPHQTGVFVQDFVPGQDTTKTRRKLAGSVIDMPIHSFGISPDGSRMTISYQEEQHSLMIAEQVHGVLPPARGAR